MATTQSATPEGQASRTDQLYVDFKSEVRANYGDLDDSNQVWRQFAYDFACRHTEGYTRSECEQAVKWVAKEVGLPKGLGRWATEDAFADVEAGDVSVDGSSAG
jgi:hypothetical protein